MVEWEDWKYRYRHMIYANISSPEKIKKGYAENLFEKKIGLFSYISDDSNSYDDTIYVVEKMLTLTYAFIHNQALELQDAEGMYHCQPLLKLKVESYGSKHS